MSALLTQCPHCNTSFRVSVAQQNAAGGLVRCGSCLAVFSASDNEIRIKQPGQEQEFESPESGETDTSTADYPWETGEAGHSAATNRMGDEEEEINAEEASSTEDLPAEIVFTMENVEPEPEAAVDIKAAPAEELHAFALAEAEEVQPDEDDYAEAAETASLVSHAGQALPKHDEPAESASLDTGHDVENAGAMFEEHSDTEENGEVESNREAKENGEYSDDSEVSDAQDEQIISLGDMLLDEHDADRDSEGYQEPTNTEGEAENAEREIESGQITAQRTSAQDKVHVREYLSALADDEEVLGPLDDTHLEELDEEPLTLTARKQRSVVMSLLLLSANLLLVAGLAAQWLFWNRASLNDSPRFSFMAPFVCSIFSCPLPEPLPVSNALSSQQLLVRTHPRFPDALELSFIFNNDDATTAQPFPNLELAFSDINNQLLANRLFTPLEYLPIELQQFEAMPPQTSVQVVIELADPGKDAVNYSIFFHDP